MITATSRVAPQHFHARWCDVETHPEWAPGMEYIRLEGPLRPGVRGVMKTRDGDETPMMVSDIVPGLAFQDTVFLDGGSLTVRHESHAADGGSRLELHATVDGPKSEELASAMAGLEEVLASDLAGLIALVEREQAAH
ncbi:SRPBCC family protein [Glutamicibacter sp. X7]